MHFCTAHVAIGGDARNIMVRDEFAPLSWPEIDVLREIHGGDAVAEVTPFVDVPQGARQERDRLAMIYGDEVLAVRWGGKNPPSELKAAGAKTRADVVWKNPLSGRVEKTTVNGSAPYTIPAETRPVAEVVGDYGIREIQAKADIPTGIEDEMYHDDEEVAVYPAPEPDPTAVEPKVAARKK